MCVVCVEEDMMFGVMQFSMVQVLGTPQYGTFGTNLTKNYYCCNPYWTLYHTTYGKSNGTIPTDIIILEMEYPHTIVERSPMVETALTTWMGTGLMCQGGPLSFW